MVKEATVVKWKATETVNEYFTEASKGKEADAVKRTIAEDVEEKETKSAEEKNDEYELIVTTTKRKRIWLIISAILQQ